MSRINSKERITLRKKFADERAEEAKNRTPQQQLERLNKMFGDGKGATKERAKLVKKMEKKVEVVEEKKED